MKKIILWFVSIFFISLYSSVFAADVDRFEVKLTPDRAKVWESLDLNIKAVDKNWNIVEDYKGKVLILSESDRDAVIPEEVYGFTTQDQWEKKFENAVKFSKSWTQDITIYDWDKETIFGRTTAEITDSWEAINTEIEIISPDDWLTIWESKIKISGSTVKNHKIKIILNSSEEFDLNSDWNGIFEKELNNLKNWENTIKAQVFDADMNVIWESSEIKIKVETNGLSIKSLKLLPEEVFVEWPYTIELITSSWLKEANVVINDSLIELKETETWVYKWTSFAPKDSGSYSVDVNLVNDLWHKLNELWVGTLKVKELNAALKQEDEPIIEPEPEVELNSPSRNSLKITWLKLVKLKTKSVLTWDKIENVKSYNIYKKNESGDLEFILKVNEPKFEINIEWDKVKYEDFYVRANWEDDNWSYLWELSDPTKIQTWPEMLIILLISLFFSGLFLLFKWAKKS